MNSKLDGRLDGTACSSSNVFVAGRASTREFPRRNAVTLVFSCCVVSAMQMSVFVGAILAQEQIEIRPAVDANEREFLIYNYRILRDGMPGAIADRAVYRKRSLIARSQVNRYKTYVTGRKLDKQIESLYVDLLDALDTTEAYLTKLDSIDRQILAATTQAVSESGFNAGVAGGSTAAMMRNQGASGEDAALAGAATAIVTWVFDASKKSQELDESKRQAIESASSDFRHKLSELQARETNTLAELAREFHWRPDGKGVKRDRLTQLLRELVVKYHNVQTPKQGLEICKAILDAATKIPAGAIYDEHREMAVYYAARLATWAAEKEFADQRKSWGSVPSPTAEYSVQLWDAALRYGAGDRGQYRLLGFESDVPENARLTYDPRDPRGLKRSQRAWALAMAGRFEEAKQDVNAVWEVRKQEPGFVLNVIRVWSSSGNLKRAEENMILHLRNVLSQLGDYGIPSDLGSKASKLEDIRTDPSLAFLRRETSKQWNELFSVKFEWNITWGTFNDDISVVNKSAFPLHKLVLSPRLESGGKIWAPTLTVPVVSPGQTYTWVNVVSIPGSRLDKAKATLDCTENSNQP